MHDTPFEAMSTEKYVIARILFTSPPPFLMQFIRAVGCFMPISKDGAAVMGSFRLFFPPRASWAVAPRNTDPDASRFS